MIILENFCEDPEVYSKAISPRITIPTKLVDLSNPNAYWELYCSLNIEGFADACSDDDGQCNLNLYVHSNAWSYHWVHWVDIRDPMPITPLPSKDEQTAINEQTAHAINVPTVEVVSNSIKWVRVRLTNRRPTLNDSGKLICEFCRRSKQGCGRAVDHIRVFGMTLYITLHRLRLS